MNLSTIQEVADFLSFQVRRSTESGDSEAALDTMKKFLELEREAKLVPSPSSDEASNVKLFPWLMPVS